MKAIILAAGEGSRLRPLTFTKPKPLIKIFGKTIIEHNLEYVYKSVSEIIFIIKYMGEEIQKYFGDSYKGVKIKYIIQGEEKGTGGALRNLNINDDVLIINGDSIFDKIDLEKIINFNGYGVLVKTVSNPQKYGIFKIDNNGNIQKVIEKSNEYVGNLANIGIYKFNSSIFEYVNQIGLSARGEYELTDAINLYVKSNSFKALEVKGDFLDISYPWDILSANKYFLDKLSSSKINGVIEDFVTIKGNIILEEGAILRSGTYIEGNVYIGKNSDIGPNIHLRGPIVIGENCRLGNGNEIKNSSIGDSVVIKHLSYLGDSIIGNNVNLGGGFKVANLRHDGTNIKVMLKGELIDSGLRKLGVIIGDNTKTGINTLVYPGRIILNNSFTLPGEIIK